MATNPQTASGTPGSSYAIPDVMAFPDDAPSAVTDSTYLADEAALRQNINQQYQELLGQLGYIDPVSGAFIPGTVEQNADIQQGILHQNMGQADLQVDQNAQNNGILFSGIRGTQRAQAELPYVQQIGQLGFDTTNTLADLYRQAQGLMGTYTTENGKLLADAASRAAAAATANPTDHPRQVDPGPVFITPSSPSGDGSTPPPDTSVITPPPTDTGAQGPTYTTAEPPPRESPPGTAIAYAKGGEVERPTNAVLGEHSRPGDPRSHEVVIPRNKLSREGNHMLDHLMAMAGIQHAALGRLGLAGGSPINAQVLHQAGLDQAAASMWVHRHPYAVQHGMEPGWVMAQLDHDRGGGGPVHSHLPVLPGDVVAGLPPVGVPHGFGPGGVVNGLPPQFDTPPGHPIHGFGPGGVVTSRFPGHMVGAHHGEGIGGIHELAHRIGLAALNRLSQQGSTLGHMPVADPGDGWSGMTPIPPPAPLTGPSPVQPIVGPAQAS